MTNKASFKSSRSNRASSGPIGITLGEPAGIGPEIFAMLAEQQILHQVLVAITDPTLLRNRAKAIQIDLEIQEISEADLATLVPATAPQVYVLPVILDTLPTPGIPSINSAQWVLDTIKKAANLCATGKLAAMVTAPVQKSIINDAGILFSGHTEYIANCINQTLNTNYQPLMMLTSGLCLPHPLRVALATTHHPLSHVPSLITKELITEKLSSLHKWLQDFYGIPDPTILVAGLNPHAGEQGHLGREDIDIIEPSILAAQTKGIKAIGPLPADTLFTPKFLGRADAVLAMYHDQGLPVLKYASFGGGINVTLGLPIVRTSVDHGTALDLAGSNKADPSSLRAALYEAGLITSQESL